MNVKPPISAHNFDTSQLDVSEYGLTGYFDIHSQCQYVLPRNERHVDTSRALLVIGHAGCDGIEFVLQPLDAAVYGYYPMEQRLEFLAPNFNTFIAGWIDGSITV